MATRQDSAEREATTTPGPTSAGRPAASPRPRPGPRRRRRQPAPALRWLRDPRAQVPALLLLTVLALSFAWQVRRPFALDIGGPDDAPYLTGFHAGEATPDGALTYRWTTADATIAIPGFGATDATLTLRLHGARPNNAPPPTIRLAIGDLPPQDLTLTPELRDYPFPVPAGAFRDGALRVAIAAPTFRPPGDARDLGVALDRVELRDAGGAGGLVAPPWAAVAVALLAVLAAYAVAAALLAAPTGGALAGLAAALVWVGCALGPRFMLARFAPELAVIVGGVAAATLLLGWAAWRLGERFDWAASRRALGGMALIAGAQLFTLLAGMRHPQFRSSDLQMNVNRLDFVRRGEWVFTLALPGPRALEAPYPPLFYAVMLPFARLVPNEALLVEVVAALAVVAGVPLTFALARRVTGADGAALWATAAYCALPIAYAMASAGNFANLFGQGVANLALVAVVLASGRWDRPPVALGLTAALTLALLGHFGVFLSLLATVPLLVLVAAFQRPDGRRQALALALCGAVALALAWALYYRFHGALLLGYLRDFLGGDTDARGAAERATMAQRLRRLWGELLLWWGWPALPLALAGINLLRRLRPAPPLALTLAWLGAALPFAALELIAGLSVRFHLFVAPALAVVAGWALWQLWRSHRHLGPLASLLLGLAWAYQALALWLDRVLHAYR